MSATVAASDRAGSSVVVPLHSEGERVAQSASADGSGRRQGTVSGRVTGLPASVLARAHPAASLALWRHGKAKPKRVRASLDGDGHFHAVDLIPGLWTLEPFMGSGFSFVAQDVEVVHGETTEVTLTGVVPRRQAFLVTLAERGVAEPPGFPWRLSVADAWGSVSTGAELEHMQSTVLVKPWVLPGAVHFSASPSGAARRDRFPQRVARTLVEVPTELGDGDPIEVLLTFDAPGSMVRVSGKVEASAQHRSYRMDATDLSGTAVHQNLKVGEDGSFALMVDLSAIVGPQIFLSCVWPRMEAGPFALGGNGLDLGEVQFTKASAVAQPSVTIFGVVDESFTFSTSTR